MQLNHNQQSKGRPNFEVTKSDLNNLFRQEINQKGIPNQNAIGDPFQFVLQMVQSAQNVNINMTVNQGLQNIETPQDLLIFQPPPYSQPQKNPASVSSPIGPPADAKPQKIFQSGLGNNQSSPTKSSHTMDNSIGNFENPTPEKSLYQIPNKPSKDKSQSSSSKKTD